MKEIEYEKVLFKYEVESRLFSMEDR